MKTEMNDTEYQQQVNDGLVKIKEGDIVRIALNGGQCTGVVLSARWYGIEDGWYIEIDKKTVTGGWELGYGYWKQKIDGGKVSILEQVVR